MIKQIKSFKYAFEGIWYTILNETHMRFHIATAFFVLIFAAIFGLSNLEWAILIVTISSVMSLELVNTAMERLCNLYSTERHPLIKIVKDVSAGAVLISAIGSVAVGFFVFFKPEKIVWVFNLFLANPLFIVCLFIAVILSVLFVVKFHPKKDKKNGISQKK